MACQERRTLVTCSSDHFRAGHIASTAYPTACLDPALNNSQLFVAFDEKKQTYAYTRCSSRLVLFLLEELISALPLPSPLD